MAISLPPTPNEISQLNTRLLLDQNTDARLRWALLPGLDLTERLDGKSLLHVFCQMRCSNLLSWGQYRTLPEGQRFPAVECDTWPLPALRSNRREKTNEWPDPELWLAATLVRNDPDPLSWSIPEVGDYFDWAVAAGQPDLIEQLVRKLEPGTLATLRKRRDASGRSALHALAASKQSSKALTTLGNTGWDINAKDKDGNTPLHMAWGAEHVAALIKGGADPFLLNSKGECARMAWIKRDMSSKSSHNPNDGGKELGDKLAALDRLSMALDPARTIEQATPAAFFLLSKEKKTGQYETKQAFSAHSIQELRLRDAQGKRWTLVGYMSRSSLGSRKTLAMTRALRLATGDKQVCLDDSEEGISNLAWLMTALAKRDREGAGANPNRADQLFDKLIEKLAEEHGVDEKGAHLHAWSSYSNAMSGLEQIQWASKTYPIKETVFFEIDRLAPSGKRDQRAKAFLRDPIPFLGLLDKAPQGTYPFAGAAKWLSSQALSGNQPQACLQALMSMVNMCNGFEGAGRSVLSELRDVIGAGIEVDTSFPGAWGRVERIKDKLGREGDHPDLAPIVSQAERSTLDAHTGRVEKSRSGVRL